MSATQHRHLLHFEGQAKKRDDQPNAGFDILTLIPAIEALALVDRFRSHVSVVPLLGQDDEHPDVQAFHARVNRRVEKVFGQSGLVPVLHGFKTVSIHRLRALWGAIAFHFFAPGRFQPFSDPIYQPLAKEEFGANV
ncbi:protelomerase family protein [Microcoleus sp. FACHB-1515]|uniref:protelomerase family protein n=1 Tax=Cyanophyceae TaxID=3028117 RepID=UPI0028C4324F|nr:protelomerase family protein [Microcoleus sp. FACHB-1515]